MVPKSVLANIKTLTEDPQVKAACGIESHMKDLRNKIEELRKQQEALPDLRGFRDVFLKEVWIPAWRINPWWDSPQGETQRSTAIPKEWEVSTSGYGVYYDSHTIDFDIQVSSKPQPIPKKLHKQTRFALRCKSKVKRQKLFDELDNALVVELDLATGKFLAPYYDNSMTWYINRNLRGYKIPLTLDMYDVQTKYRALEEKREIAKKELNDFYNIIPAPVRFILGSFGGLSWF